MKHLFCPICGQKLIDKEAGDDGFVPYCKHCNKLWFDSFSSCVIILIYNEYNEVALLKQSYLSDKYSSLVAGYITPGETAESAAIREVNEELGIKLENLTFAGTYWFNKQELLMIGFIAKTKKCDFVLSSEVDSASWVKASEVGNYLFPEAPGNAAFPIYRKFLKMCED